MKSTFEGLVHETIPTGWNERTRENFMLNSDFLQIVKKASNMAFRLVTHPDYCCVEYDIRLNLLSFSRFYLPVKITMIGVPVSICKKGYTGDLEALVRDYRKRKGLYLILNDDERLLQRTGRTLPTCIFDNEYGSFEDYIEALRSSYRRRVRSALKKGEHLTVERVANQGFTDEMYRLYTNVVAASRYPLEILNISFFQLFDGEIFCFYSEGVPVAFVLLKGLGDTLYFILGGMNYGRRDEFDLYYNMLLFIVKRGIAGSFSKIYFGQTAEASKMRIGCQCQNKYMHVLTKNKAADFMLKRLVCAFEYKLKSESLNVFRTSKVQDRGV